MNTKSFRYQAGLAAKFERSGSYLKAMHHWNKAQQANCDLKDERWARIRKEVCATRYRDMLNDVE